MNVKKPISRRTFVAASTAAAITAPLVHTSAQTTRGNELLLGLAADAQFADVAAAGARHYREGDNRLADAVKEFNKSNVDICFHLGDLIDRDFASFDSCLKSLTDLKAPVHHVLGNHDFDVADDKKQDVPKRIGMKSQYSSVRMNPFRFIFLDGTEVSTFAHPKEDARTQSAQARLDELKKSGARNAQSWNGGVSQKQVDWLGTELTSATENSEQVILFCHYPVFPANVHNLWNDREVLALIDKHPCVVAWFNGHNHAGNYGVRNGVHYVTVSGMVEHAESNAFATARLSQKGISLKGYGRQPSRELEFRSQPQAVAN